MKADRARLAQGAPSILDAGRLAAEKPQDLGSGPTLFFLGGTKPYMSPPR